MKYFVRVCFQNTSKSYYFSTDLEEIKKGDKVVVETLKGVELATIVSSLMPIEEYTANIPLKEILRIATDSDIATAEFNKLKANTAAKIFIEESAALNLDMHLLSTEYTLDATKVLFTYSSSDRVDFRELLKILANKLKARIELKQIAPRDRAQLIGGLGPCGLPICCSTFLTEFDGISINRAKNQMLTINIPKLSGQCGKLLCCLKYEDDQYNEAKKEFPEIGTKLVVDNIEYKVNSYNILSKSIRLDSEDKIIYMSLEDFKKKSAKKGKFHK